MKFQVEALMNDIGSGVVMVKALALGPFRLGPGSTLGGAAIHPEVTAPHATRPDGSLRTDLCGFSLKNRSGMASFALGQVIDLLGADAA